MFEGGEQGGKGAGILYPTVLVKPMGRWFTAERTIRTPREADHCAKSSRFGALLRRKGLYSSHVNTWRWQGDEGTLASLTPSP